MLVAKQVAEQLQQAPDGVGVALPARGAQPEPAREGIGAIRFPIRQSYVYVLRRGGYNPDMMGLGVVPELLGLAVGAIQLEGVWHDIYVTSVAAKPAESSDTLEPAAQGAGGS
jgi:hypothetical protein